MRARLATLYFLQFAIWGCYLTCFGQLLGAGGLGGDIAWFYAAIGLVSIVTPPLLGRMADRTGRPGTLLGACHLGAAVVMLAMWRYASAHPHALEFGVMLPLYLLFLALYMPTMALANTTTFGLLTQSGRNPVTAFPPIRIWGTVGFVAAMWGVNSLYWSDGHLGLAFSDSDPAGHLRFQYNSMQLLCSGVVALLASLYAFSLPNPKVEQSKAEEDSPSKPGIFQAIKAMTANRSTLAFLVFVALAGVCLQISNGFATPYITHFLGIPEYSGALAAGNATMLFSLSQISEAAFVMLVGVFLKSKGIRWVYAAGLAAWGLRFLLLGTGNPGDGLWMLVGSMLVYGLAFNFITIAGHLHIQEVAPKGMKGFAQGVMMFMSNGIGATFGTLVAGAVVNHWCHWQMVAVGREGTAMRLFMGDWWMPWLIFAIYAFGVALLWMATPKAPKR